MKKLMLLPALLLVAFSASSVRADCDHDDDCDCHHDDGRHVEEVNFDDDTGMASEEVVYVSSDDVIFEEDTRHYDPSTKPSALPNTERRMGAMDDDCEECPED